MWSGLKRMLEAERVTLPNIYRLLIFLYHRKTLNLLLFAESVIHLQHCKRNEVEPKLEVI